MRPMRQAKMEFVKDLLKALAGADPRLTGIGPIPKEINRALQAIAWRALRTSSGGWAIPVSKGSPPARVFLRSFANSIFMAFMAPSTGFDWGGVPVV